MLGTILLAYFLVGLVVFFVLVPPNKKASKIPAFYIGTFWIITIPYICYLIYKSKK